MAQMAFDTISSHRLRRENLLEYLRSVFPSHREYITAQVRIMRLWNTCRFLKPESKTFSKLNNRG